MPEDDAFANDLRRHRRNIRLGADASCFICGYRKPEGLVTGPSELLEGDHTLGKANDSDLTARLCRNCHAERTEGQRDAGVDLRHNDRHLLERLEAGLRSSADFHHRLAESEWKRAKDLADLISRLDKAGISWRDL
ncbi:MAG: hypothetical protein IH941_07310 [Acidobacteria bacterium]|nr:hypothetical protein [Acidobacteriota bacterium]